MADVTALIEQDHREVEQLFAEFEDSRESSVAVKICDELDRHASAEEKVFYPAVAEDVPDGQNLADEGKHEHDEARRLIGQIRDTPDTEHLVGIVGELKTAINHHVHEEESEMLPKARQSLDAARLDELGADFEDAKKA